MKYKVGDMVRVRSDLVIKKYYGSRYFTIEMDKLSSNIVTIQAVLTNRYYIKEDNGRFGWTDEMFEDIKEDKMDNNTLQINMNNLTDEERTTLLSLIEKANKPKNKVWKPKEKYFCLFGDGSVHVDRWSNCNIDHSRNALGNCFKTKEETEFALERQKVITELKRYALEHNEIEIDWNTGKKKFYIYYSYSINRIDIDFTIAMKENTVYFTSSEIAQSAIKAVGEDRIKKYYFEVND